jgi:hypothetical protein
MISGRELYLCQSTEDSFKARGPGRTATSELEDNKNAGPVADERYATN